MPIPNYGGALVSSDIDFMNMAFEEAKRSKSDNEWDPRVGVVIVKDGQVVEKAHRGETGKGHHAEFIALQKKARSEDILNGATLYTTLEPCTTRNHEKLPCVGWILRKKLERVVIGILDPNPNICGRGYWKLIEGNVKVDFFDSGLVTKVTELNKPFIELFRGGKHFDNSFAELTERHKSAVITQFPGIGWGEDLCLQICPELREGWPLQQVELIHDDNKWFSIPDVYRDSYQIYFQEKYQDKRFFDNREKFMLIKNPIAFSDSPTLKLQTMLCRYSETLYYAENVATVGSRRNPLIQESVTGSLEIKFPHNLCMHMVVVTSDNQVLITKRSPKVEEAFHPNTWSCSIEEQLARKDLLQGSTLVLQQWAKRMLFEELGLDTDAYRFDNIRILSVFLESDVLGISVCVFAELSVDSNKLDSILRGLRRTDYEFTEWLFLEFSPTTLLKEMIRPNRVYHPSSGYRMLMALLKRFGEREMTKVLPQLGEPR